MSHSRLAATLLLFAVAAGGARAADGGSIVRSHFQGMANAYLGSEHRDTINRLFADGVTPAQGREGVKPVLDWCDAHSSDDQVTYVSVADEREAEEFRRTRPHEQRVVLIDSACPMAYKAMAYWAAEDGDMEGALPWLDKAIRIAPYFDEAYTERGFDLNQLHRPAEAADWYRQALVLLDRHPNPESKGVALRGLGYALVELGDLAGARKAYEDSLKVVPGNKTALSELEYVEGLEKKQR